jgi:hypothetical protein
MRHSCSKTEQLSGRKFQKNDHIFNESSAGVRYKLSSQIDVTLNFHHTSEDDERLMFGLQRNF